MRTSLLGALLLCFRLSSATTNLYDLIIETRAAKASSSNIFLTDNYLSLPDSKICPMGYRQLIENASSSEEESR